MTLAVRHHRRQHLEARYSRRLNREQVHIHRVPLNVCRRILHVPIGSRIFAAYHDN